MRRKIPVAHAVFGVDKLLEQKELYRPLLGVQIKNTPNGVIIIEVSEGSVAAAGDIWSLGITLIELAQTKPPQADVHSVFKVMTQS